jgi:hypothetical protein
MYSRRLFIQNVWDLTCSRLMIYPELDILTPKDHSDKKKDVLAHMVPDIRYGI